MTTPFTVRELIDGIARRMPPPDPMSTVDTIKWGDPDREVRGVAVTFMATVEVIRAAREAGANLLITHEPTFYQHDDPLEWLSEDPIMQAKRALLDEFGMVVWRLHDGIHRHRPDGIVEGMRAALGWDALPGQPNVYDPGLGTLRELVAHLKRALQIPVVRVVGDLDMPCGRVGMLVGAHGGRRQMEFFRQSGVEILLCGEIAEWETCEYVRDANLLGQRKALVVLGHSHSEESGMRWLAEWLRSWLPGELPVTFLSAGHPFQFV
jgi:putative NIF3 family GTP cyclohydrolase 1 type 2